MRARYKVVSAGLAIVIGCGAVAAFPFDLPFAHSAAAVTGSAEARELNVSSVASDARSVQVDEASQNQEQLYKDGVYRARAQGKFGEVGVCVTIVDGRISRVALDANSESAPMAQTARDAVVPQILETQSVDDIDAAAGATMTSEAIVEAVSQVLDRARL